MQTANAITKLAAVAALFWASDSLAQTEVRPLPHSRRPHRIVLVSIPDRQLAVLEDGVVLRTFPVSVGAANSPSPIGEFEIVSRVAHPSYYHLGKVIPAGPSNPLGPRWMGLSIKGYGIHGTDAPRSIGKAASHGCIRLSNHDIVELYPLLSVGDRVEIRARRDSQISQIFGVEDHVTVAQARQNTSRNQNAR